MFTTINEADQKASKLTEYVTLIVGKTRAGKSTFLNWLINGKALIGVEDGANTIYALRKDVNNPELAKIDNTIKSVTVMPNIKQIDKDSLIIDLPGF